MRNSYLKAFLVFALLASIAFLCPTHAQAVLYGVTYDHQFITIDETTGVGTIVGPLDTFMYPGGLGERSGKLYTWDQGGNVIAELDPVTGHTLSTFDIGLAGPPPIFGEGAITFRSDGIGFLATGGPTGQLGEPGRLWEFDIDLLTIALVGNLIPDFDGMDFYGCDTLFGLEQTSAGQYSDLHTINTSTAATTLVGADNSGVWGAYVAGLTFDEDGILYAAIGTRTDPAIPATIYDLYRYDPASGVPTLIGPIGDYEISGISSLNSPPCAPIPEPGTMLLLAFGLIGLAGFSRKKFKKR